MFSRLKMLTNEISGIIPVSPEGGKIARAAISPFVEAGSVYLPDPLHAPWVTTHNHQIVAAQGARFLLATSQFPVPTQSGR